MPAPASYLETGTRPLVEIAAACGFYDQADLTNVFKGHADVTLSGYRKAIQT